MRALIPNPCTGWTPGVLRQMEEARVGVWGRVLHGHRGWRVSDLGPVLVGMVRYHGWHGWVGIGIGAADVLRVGFHVVEIGRAHV